MGTKKGNFGGKMTKTIEYIKAVGVCVWERERECVCACACAQSCLTLCDPARRSRKGCDCSST